MILNKDRKRRTIQILRFSVAMVVTLIVFMGCMANGPIKAEVSEDFDVRMDGLYLMLDGSVDISNGMFSGLDDADVIVYLKDTKYDKRMMLWKGEDITIERQSDTKIQIHSRVSAFSIVASILDSIKMEDSELELNLHISGKCMYGLVDADLITDIGLPLAKDGTVLGYSVDVNTADTFSLTINNLVDNFVPDDETIHIVSGTQTLTISMFSDNLGLHITAVGRDSLESAIGSSHIMIESLTTESGTEMDEDSIQYLMIAIEYLRWFL